MAAYYPTFVGVDLETTSSKKPRFGKTDEQVGRTIQLGMAYWPDIEDPLTFCSDVGWDRREPYNVQKKALEVNGFTYDRIIHGTRRPDVEKAAVAWLKKIRALAAPVADHVYKPGNGDKCSWTEFRRLEKGEPCGKTRGLHTGEGLTLIPVGWNVAGFDWPFVERDFPQVASEFAYRTVDLNAIVFNLSEAREEPYDEIKGAAKDYGAACMKDLESPGLTNVATWHDAGYDATASLFSWEYLRSLSRATA